MKNYKINYDINEFYNIDNINWSYLSANPSIFKEESMPNL